MTALLSVAASSDVPFAQYVKEFQKDYSAEEYQLRETIYNLRVEAIRGHNDRFDAGMVSYSMGINKFTDMNEDEIRMFRGYKPGNSAVSLNAEATPLVPLQDLPNSVDWRKQSAITPVKNQGGCGSCWAFASTETLESHWFIQTGTLPVLAPQQLVDCTPNPDQCGGTGGCEGATAELAFTYLINGTRNGGLAAESSYPYTARDGTCKDTVPAVASVTGFVKVDENNYQAVMNAVALQGPLAVAVDASRWSFYGGGIFDGCPISGNIDIDHLVQLVGYGTDAGQAYWIVRNSWGSGWGEQGYIRLKRDETGNTCGTDFTPSDGSGCRDGPPTVTACGTCGVIYDTVYPTFN
jgi:cathepsin L